MLCAYDCAPSANDRAARADETGTRENPLGEIVRRTSRGVSINLLPLDSRPFDVTHGGTTTRGRTRTAFGSRAIVVAVLVSGLAAPVSAVAESAGIALCEPDFAAFLAE